MIIKSKLTKVEWIALVIVLVMLFGFAFGFYQIRKTIKSEEFQEDFKKEATEFRDWIKG